MHKVNSELGEYDGYELFKPLVIEGDYDGKMWYLWCEDLSIAGHGRTYDRALIGLWESFSMAVEEYALSNDVMTKGASEYAGKVRSYLKEPVYVVHSPNVLGRITKYFKR